MAWARPVVDLQGAHDAHGRHAPQLERADQAQHIVPMRCDAIQAHALAGQCVEFSVIGLGINAPKARAADVGQAWTEAVAQQPE